MIKFNKFLKTIAKRLNNNQIEIKQEFNKILQENRWNFNRNLIEIQWKKI